MVSPVDERLHLLGLADYLELPPPLVAQLLRRSSLPGHKAGGLWNFDRAEVDRWLDLGMPGWHHDELHAVATMDLPSSVDRPTLVQRLLAREHMSSTALDNGFAIPHTSRTRPRLVVRNVRRTEEYR